MAERKEPKEVPPQGRKPGNQMSEKSPNQHRKSNILQMPTRTQQRNETTGRNIPQAPNTVGGNLNPSVAHDFEKHVVNPTNASDKRARTARDVKEFKRKDA
jgi:hypothetical protein